MRHREVQAALVLAALLMLLALLAFMLIESPSRGERGRGGGEKGATFHAKRIKPLRRRGQLTRRGPFRIRAAHLVARAPVPHPEKSKVMKVRSSLKSLKTRHRDCKLVRRKGVVYVINKTNPRFKAKQG